MIAKIQSIIGIARVFLLKSWKS